MSTPDKPKQVTDLIMQSIKNFDGTDATSSQDLLSGLGDILKTASEMAEVNPEMAQKHSELVRDVEQMQALLDQIRIAQEQGDTDTMMALSTAAAELGGVDMSPEVLPAPYDALQDAINEGDFDAVRDILKTKPDLNQLVGKYQSTPLLWAMRAEGRNPTMLAVLVEAGADVTFATPEGYTALHSVGDYSHRYQVTAEDDYAVAAYLVAQGGDLTARNHYGWTSLDRAVIEGVPEEVHALLRVGADPNLGRNTAPTLCFETGNTPLANAVANPEIIRLLLEFGADPKTKSAQCATVFDEIDRLLAGEETDDSYPQFYDDLRASRVLIAAALRSN